MINPSIESRSKLVVLTAQTFKLGYDLVEAMQWRGNNQKEILAFAGVKLQPGTEPGFLALQASDGKRWLIVIGDWIVKGPEKEIIYAVKDNYFNTYYELYKY